MVHRRRSSAHVTLVLAGAAAYAGCGRDAEARGGKRYASKAECVADWGTEEDCKEQVSTGSGGHVSHSWMYFGASRLIRGAGAGVHAGDAVQPGPGSAPRAVSRGGFGTTGRAGVSS